jgi:L-lactate dehydrogenase complex protein LldF
MNHPQQAAAFIANRERAKWHDQALWFVRAKRDRAAATVPEWEELREHAAHIKQFTLAHLPDLLEQFEREAIRRGAVVHWAADAEEHNRIVHGLLARNGIRKVVKSKSMLTEECHLNPYLEARGIEVVDTDLGEWIVQLRNEPPSHIVMHRGRRDRPGLPGGSRPADAAGEVSRGRGRHHGSEFRRRRDRRIRRLHKRR